MAAVGKASKSHSKARREPAAIVTAPVAPAPSSNRRADLYLYLLLSAVTLAVYSQVVHFDFLNYDDPDYVTGNVFVRRGFTWDGLTWAFTSFHAANWSPLTWLSHMADCQWFGLRSGWHHGTSVVLHAAAACLLLAALERMTGARWRSALVAFLFALHPLHVESVAWIAERKDVLCALFWFLAIYLYARYARRPGAAGYLMVLGAFALGLLAKAMIVTLPLLLLLLDYWPLRRPWRRALLWEKLPMAALAAAAAVLTYVAQQGGYTMRSLSAIPLGARIANAVVAYATYLVRMFWPARLAVFYPYRLALPPWQVALAGAALAGITAVVLLRARALPYLAVGWFWYLGTMVPVIGLVQVGAQSSADRYMYVPMVGLGIVLAWGGADLLTRRAPAAAAIAVAAMAVCAVVTWHQLGYWADSGRLFQHAVEVTSGNYIAHNNLAQFYLTEMRNQDALGQSEDALRIRPGYPEAHVNRALALRRLGKLEESEAEYRTALRLLPESEPAHMGYGALLVVDGRTGEALREFSTAVGLRPDDDDAHYNLGRVLAAVGRTDQAVGEYYAAIGLRPENAEARHSLGFLLLSRGRMDEALAQLRAEARLKPDDAGVHYNLGTFLVSARRFDEAIEQFAEALRIRPDFAEARRRLEMARAQRDSRPR
jgi:tetratricopeptide (TPR) repeat protein